jgi:hypothetical protein
MMARAPRHLAPPPSRRALARPPQDEGRWVLSSKRSPHGPPIPIGGQCGDPAPIAKPDFAAAPAGLRISLPPCGGGPGWGPGMTCMAVGVPASTGQPLPRISPPLHPRSACTPPPRGEGLGVGSGRACQPEIMTFQQASPPCTPDPRSGAMRRSGPLVTGGFRYRSIRATLARFI